LNQSSSTSKLNRISNLTLTKPMEVTNGIQE
jgi:hypothetical protein